MKITILTLFNDNKMKENMCFTEIEINRGRPLENMFQLCGCSIY